MEGFATAEFQFAAVGNLPSSGEVSILVTDLTSPDGYIVDSEQVEVSSSHIIVAPGEEQTIRLVLPVDAIKPRSYYGSVLLSTVEGVKQTIPLLLSFDATSPHVIYLPILRH